MYGHYEKGGALPVIKQEIVIDAWMKFNGGIPAPGRKSKHGQANQGSPQARYVISKLREFFGRPDTKLAISYKRPMRLSVEIMSKYTRSKRFADRPSYVRTPPYTWNVLSMLFYRMAKLDTNLVHAKRAAEISVTRRAGPKNAIIMKLEFLTDVKYHERVTDSEVEAILKARPSASA